MRFTTVICSLLALLILTVPAYAQEGTVFGKATDRDGKPIVGATVSIDRKEYTQHLEIKTNKSGEYLMVCISNGTFRISLIHDGVTLAVTDNFPLNFGDRRELNFDLKKLDQAPDQVEVETMDRAQREAENIANNETQGAFKAGVTAQTARDYEEAIKQFTLAASRQPKMAVIHARLGAVYSAARKFPEAADAYKKAGELTPNSNYFMKWGTAACKANRMQECQDAVAKAVEVDPPVAPVAYTSLGTVLSEAGKTQEAEAALKKAISHNAKFAEAYYQLGMLYLADPKNTTNAVPQFEKYLQLNPKAENAAVVKQLIEATKAASKK